MSEHGKKVPEDSDWHFGNNIVSWINQIKAKQQALGSDGFKNSKNRDSGILKSPRESTKRVLPDTAKKRTEQQQLPLKPARETLSSEEEQILKQINKYELTTKCIGRNTKLFDKNWKKLTLNK